jgi:NAD(P)-dependent dehydrogenase (short-subunit alcohol dehydrogenase family)
MAPDCHHFSRSAALDETLLANPAHIVSLAPGVIDTDMQTDLRSGNPTGFELKDAERWAVQLGEGFEVRPCAVTRQ